jgi:hypothetical protein
LGVGFSLCFFHCEFGTESLLLCSAPFLLVGSVYHPPLPLCVFDYSLLFVFQFCRTVWCWMLLSGSGDHLCDPLPSLLWAMACHPPALSLCCLSCVYLLRVCSLPLLLWCMFSIPPTPLSCLCLITVHSLFFSFVRGIRLPRGCVGLCSHVVCDAPTWCVVLLCSFCQLMHRQVWSH